MRFGLGIFSIFAAYKFIKCLDPFITGGSYVEYSKYPHSAFILNFCADRFSCGGSIINQQIILTAAHCLEDCIGTENPKLFVKYGHKKIKKQSQTVTKHFKIHEYYDDITLTNDIGLIMTRDLIPLNDIVKRVILMRYPPDEKQAYVAGWGVDENMEPQWSLKHTAAMLHSHDVCLRMGYLPRGVFCAGPLHGVGAADRGDSGSALIINDFIQIGIVSFKGPDFSLVAYSNVSFYLDWIQERSGDMFCSNKTEENLPEKKDLIKK
nr:trypsin Tyr p 3.0101-like [Plodia interpunctella]